LLLNFRIFGYNIVFLTFNNHQQQQNNGTLRTSRRPKPQQGITQWEQPNDLLCTREEFLSFLVMSRNGGLEQDWAPFQHNYNNNNICNYLQLAPRTSAAAAPSYLLSEELSAKMWTSRHVEVLLQLHDTMEQLPLAKGRESEGIASLIATRLAGPDLSGNQFYSYFRLIIFSLN
jgi:hypothetical protein